MHKNKRRVSLEFARYSYFLRKEITRPERCRVPFEELIPDGFCSVRCRFGTVLFEYGSCSSSGNRYDLEFVQFAQFSGMPQPVRVEDQSSVPAGQPKHWEEREI